MKVSLGDFTVPTLLSIDTSQWKAGVDPMFAAITKALDSYQKAQSEELCTQDHVTREQYEAAVRFVGRLRQWIEKACAEYWCKVQGLGLHEAACTHEYSMT